MNDQERPLISMWTSACTSMNKCECHSHSEAFHTKAHAKKKKTGFGLFPELHKFSASI